MMDSRFTESSSSLKAADDMRGLPYSSQSTHDCGMRRNRRSCPSMFGSSSKTRPGIDRLFEIANYGLEHIAVFRQRMLGFMSVRTISMVEKWLFIAIKHK